MRQTFGLRLYWGSPEHRLGQVIARPDHTGHKPQRFFRVRGFLIRPSNEQFSNPASDILLLLYRDRETGHVLSVYSHNLRRGIGLLAA